MKKKFKIITIAVIILILSILTIFCSKINKISLIKNIKHKVVKAEEIQTADEITIINVTDLKDNGNIEHEHINKTMYNDNEHWEECKICGEKSNESNHTFTDNWNLGNAQDCNPNNINKRICKCGYSYETTSGRKSHILKYENNTGGYWGAKVCQNCRIYREDEHECKKNDGTRINCSNLGECSLCHFTYDKNRATHVGYWFNNIQGNITCTICNTYMGRANKHELIKESDNVYKLSTSIKVPDNIDTIKNETEVDQYFGNNVTIRDNGISKNGTTWNHDATITFNGYNESRSTAFLKNKFKLNNIQCQIIMQKTFSIDEKQPTISNITSKDNNLLDEWSNNKPIIITGTENYCSTVIAKILDNDANTIFEGKGEVNNKNYSISCIPEINIEIGEEPKKFIVIITDSAGNSTSQEFTIAKVDIIPPKPTSSEAIGGDWAKSKDFTFTATDYGIGEVQVAFNDIKDLKLAKENENTYSRDYKFIGDVYNEKKLSVMYKDGLGNTSIQKITIDKIDNTAPTITNIELHNNKITVTSHDEHKELGEGSGVVKYRYLASEEKIENPKLTNENSIEVLKDEEIQIKDIYKTKYIYLVAEDYVGNISEIYEFKVPELKLIATANPNTANGKGEIILDWSSYDVEDKYFVVYRKKENETQWKEIVPLEQKLTGITYTDMLANDEADPNIPSITITSNAENNNIKITSTAIDSGSTYNYYIEAYDSTETLISKSN